MRNEEEYWASTRGVFHIRIALTISSLFTTSTLLLAVAIYFLTREPARRKQYVSGLLRLAVLSCRVTPLVYVVGTNALFGWVMMTAWFFSTSAYIGLFALLLYQVSLRGGWNTAKNAVVIVLGIVSQICPLRLVYNSRFMYIKLVLAGGPFDEDNAQNAALLPGFFLRNNGIFSFKLWAKSRFRCTSFQKKPKNTKVRHGLQGERSRRCICFFLQHVPFM